MQIRMGDKEELFQRPLFIFYLTVIIKKKKVILSYVSFVSCSHYGKSENPLIFVIVVKIDQRANNFSKIYVWYVHDICKYMGQFFCP